MASTWLLGLAGVGALTLASIAGTIIRFAIFHLSTPSVPLQAYKRPGPDPTYALITGASAGIGYGIAHSLGVVLLGHLPDELEAAAAKLRKLNPNLPPAAVRTLVMDARTATPDDLLAAVRALSDLQVSILVNNIGGSPISQEGGPPFRTHANYDCDDVDAVINMNVRYMARLTALMLPLLSQRTVPTSNNKEQRSLILNLSSGAAVGVPWLVMYGATKGFVNSFSIGLARELEAVPETAHIDCLVIQPGEVRTQGNCEGVWEGEPDGDTFGRLIVERADGAVSRGMRAVSPYWVHDMGARILAWTPESMASREVTKALAHKRDSFNDGWAKARKGK